MTNFDVDYFLAKFEAIPEEEWCREKLSDYNGRHCAMGHCGCRDNGEITAEASALDNLFDKYLSMPVVDVNDFLDIQGRTPKQRILAALRDIKAGMI